MTQFTEVQAAENAANELWYQYLEQNYEQLMDAKIETDRLRVSYEKALLDGHRELYCGFYRKLMHAEIDYMRWLDQFKLDAVGMCEEIEMVYF